MKRLGLYIICLFSLISANCFLIPATPSASVEVTFKNESSYDLNIYFEVSDKGWLFNFPEGITLEKEKVTSIKWEESGYYYCPPLNNENIEKILFRNIETIEIIKELYENIGNLFVVTDSYRTKSGSITEKNSFIKYLVTITNDLLD